MHVTTTGNDPQFTTEGTLDSPPGEYSFELRMRAKAKGNGQVFLAGPSKRVVPGTFVPVAVKHDGEWHEYQAVKTVTLPVGLIRVDPCAGAGEVDIEWMRLRNAAGDTVAEWLFR